MIKIKL